MKKQQKLLIFSVHLTPNQLSSKHPSQLTASVSKLKGLLFSAPCHITSLRKQTNCLLEQGHYNFLLLHNSILLFANALETIDLNFQTAHFSTHKTTVCDFEVNFFFAWFFLKLYCTRYYCLHVTPLCFKEIFKMPSVFIFIPWNLEVMSISSFNLYQSHDP